jgi:non-canonical (house-cleaning) NTP pyrophosphatase
LDAQCRKDRGTSACFKVPTYFVHKCLLYSLKGQAASSFFKLQTETTSKHQVWSFGSWSPLMK